MKTLKTTTNLLLTILIISCTNQNEVITEEYSSEFKKYIESKSYKILSNTYPNFTKGLDALNVLQHSENETLSHIIKSKMNEQPLGVLYFSKNSENEYKTIVEIYSYDGNGNLKEVQFNNILGQEILTANLTKTSKNLYSFKIKNQPNLFNKRSWWSCTKGCIGDAWGFCSNDPECDYVCALTGGYLGCTASIATACAGWCAIDTDNDLTPEEH